MKLRGPATVPACLALFVGVVLCTGVAETRPQLEEAGLAIYGTVMVPGTRQPVPGARVRLTQGSPPGQFSFVPPDEGTFTTADASGRFSFTGLTPGPYDITPMALEDPEDLVISGRARVELTANALPPDVRLWVAPKSEISGRITDADGEPVAGTAVGVFVPSWRFGRRALGSATETPGTVLTDEDGGYALQVVPGEYYLRVGSTDQGVVPRYYPGVLFPEDAVTLDVRSGVNVPGLNMALEPVEQARLRFRFPVPQTVAGVPQPLSSYMPPETPLFDMRVQPMGRGLITAPTYRLAFEALGEDAYLTAPLPPGEYEIALQYSVELMSTIARELRPATLSASTFLQPLAHFSVAVDEAENGSVADLGAIPAITTVSISGRVVLRGTETDSFDRSSFPRFSLTEASFLLGEKLPTIGQNGTFIIDDVPAGVYAFQYPGPRGLPGGWYYQSIRSGVRDLQTDGLEVAGTVSPIEIVLANDAGRIEGIVRSADGDLVPNAQIVLIPPANRRGPFSLFTRTEAGASGAYAIESVPPGEYRLLALDVAGLTGINWQSPEFLRDYELRGERITVDPGARMTIDAEAIPYVP